MRLTSRSGWRENMTSGDDKTYLLSGHPRETFKNLASAGYLTLLGNKDKTESRKSTTGSEPDAAGQGGPVEISSLPSCEGKFEVGEAIGQGGQGVVSKAVQLHLGRVIAVKSARPEAGIQRDFLKEALTTAHLDHPNIVPVYDLGRLGEGQDESPLLAMKLVRGVSWNELLARDREEEGFTLDSLLLRHIPILVDVINAVAFAHSRRIIHRDLKPSQVMVGDFGEVYLLDWGLAVYLGGPEEKTAAGKRSGNCFFTLDSAVNPAGTPAYMAPEQTALGTRRLGTWTDIYLLGAMLYELLAGHPPHREKTVQSALIAAENNRFDPLPAHVPGELAGLVNRCMATNPADRPGSALEVRESVEAWLTGAGRRDASTRVSDKLRARHIGRAADYGELSAIGRELEEAAQLWPENPELTGLRDHLYARYVEVALENEDFALARVQAARLTDQQTASALRQRLEEAREQFIAKCDPPPIFTPLRAISLGASLLAIAAALFLLLRVAEQSTLDEIHDKVRSLATLTAMEVNPADLMAVDRTRNIQTPEFQAVLARMNTLRRANEDIRFIYTMRPENITEGVWRTLVDADPYDIDVTGDGTIDLEGNPPGNLYPYGVAAMEKAFAEGEPASALVRDAWGEFISGFAPVRDRRTGEIVAVAGVDIEKALVDRRLRGLRVAVIAAGALCVLLVVTAFTAFFVSLRSLKRDRLIRELLQRREGEADRGGIHLG